MTTEELLKPRRKVIAPWPGMERDGIKVGDIIIDPDRPNECCRYLDGSAAFTFDWDKYPHLFKRLEWWEERKPEDMPEYVKYDDVSLFVPKQRVCKGSQAPFNAFNFTAVDFLPATESEYQSFIQR